MKITLAMLDSWNALHLEGTGAVEKLQRRFDEWGCPTCIFRGAGFICEADETAKQKEIQRVPECPKKSMTPEEIHELEAEFRNAPAPGWLEDEKESYYKYPEVQEDIYSTIKAYEPEWEPDPKRVRASKR